MKVLKDILYKVALNSTSGDMNLEVSSIAFDSRKVSSGSLFVAVKGTQSDGHAFIQQAILAGATSVVCESVPDQLVNGVTYVEVKSSSEALGIVAANFYENPSKKIQLIGVTGTNGKTTIATLLYHLFRNLGYNCGLISTVENKINDEKIPSTHTTPDPIRLNELFDEMINKGCTHCFMEVSSHAIVQHRIAGLNFKGAIFSNITHDHLDYHGTFDNYIKAKKVFFDGLSPFSFALTNIDDRRGKVMVQNTKASIKTYAIKNVADYKLKILSSSFSGLEVELDGGVQTWFRLVGDFNAYNLLAVFATATELGEDAKEVLTQLSTIEAAPGRFEQVRTNSGVMALVDYAHTPDALKNVLDTIKRFRTGNESVITVVGCGGNRDKDKRPLMAEIACKLSDKVVLTSDNPRDEEPEQIIKDMEEGVSPSNYRKKLSVTDRKEAIKLACTLAEKNDIILVAGKGHEDYQEIKGVRYPFDDKKVLKEMLELTQNQA
ncbi:MAG: UDP-N-acetylmuramoyl-L-alanyl-D-glutamate--2,6-diaminopimelate ligase [Bacteroidota bacterium]